MGVDRALLQSRSQRETRLIQSPRFKGGRFHNTHRVRMMAAPPSWDMMTDFVAGSGRRSPKRALPVFAHTQATLATPVEGGLRVTWLGHSTVLLEVDGVRLLTDPVFGLRASPLSFAGPKRFHPPPLPLHQLGRIDAVLLSHDHYDHLCAWTVRNLAAGEAPGFSGRFITALGVGAHLEAMGVQPHNITELDWGGGVKLGDVNVVATPAQHFSGRGLERNGTLWAGFAVLGPHHRVFFSGDTGPTPEHRDIGASLGPFDVAMFEIGAFHPAWGDIHLGPDNAFAAFEQANARAMLPIHWSTFDLGLHPWEEPGELLLARARSLGAPLWTPQLGEPIQQATPAAYGTPWWRTVLNAAPQPGSTPLVGSVAGPPR